MLLGSCSGDEPPAEHIGAVEQRIDIPTSATCTLGVGASKCVSVPPTQLSSADLESRMILDGERNRLEWAGATRLPYTDLQTYGTGSVYLRAMHDTDGPRYWLYVYLEDITVPDQWWQSPLGGTPASARTTMYVFLDHDRFSSAEEYGKTPDRVFAFGLLDGTVQRVYRPVKTPTEVKLLQVDESFELVRRSCTIDPSMAHLCRCNAELRIPLLYSDLTRPFQDLSPGAGFSVQRVNKAQGSVPELIASHAKQGIESRPWFYRAYAQTLLLAPPKGFPVKYISWNLRQSDTAVLGGPFYGVLPEALGPLLSDYNVIALQEVWSEDRLDRLLRAANQDRETRGLPLLTALGPADFNPGPFITGQCGVLVRLDAGLPTSSYAPS